MIAQENRDLKPIVKNIITAIRSVLDQTNYRVAARKIADEFAAIDTRSELVRIISELVKGSRVRGAKTQLAAE